PPPRSTLFPYTTLFRSIEVRHHLIWGRTIARQEKLDSSLDLVPVCINRPETSSIEIADRGKGELRHHGVLVNLRVIYNGTELSEPPSVVILTYPDDEIAWFVEAVKVNVVPSAEPE